MGRWEASVCVGRVRMTGHITVKTAMISPMWQVTSLRQFSLIRRLGRGGYAMVYAARKEDTASLVAMKVTDLRYKKAKLHHILMERDVAARVAGQPFLCGLTHAFRSGPLLVMTMPLYEGGTLQAPQYG